HTACPAPATRPRRRTPPAAFHSPLVPDAGGRLAELLRTIQVREPRREVLGNADAQPYPAEPDTIRLRIAEHLTSPVLFTEQVEAMYRSGVRTFVEVGAGDTLARLVGQILGDREHLAVGLDRRGTDGVTALHNALGRLAVQGVELDPEALSADHRPPAAPSAGSRSRSTTKVTGASYGRSYPPPRGAAELPPPHPAAPHPAAGALPLP